jgi:hypothetical protein
VGLAAARHLGVALPTHLFTARQLPFGLQQARSAFALASTATLALAGHLAVRPAPCGPCSLVVLLRYVLLRTACPHVSAPCWPGFGPPASPPGLCAFCI